MRGKTAKRIRKAASKEFTDEWKREPVYIGKQASNPFLNKYRNAKKLWREGKLELRADD